MSRPLAIDLYCGLGGWAEGFLSEGYEVIGFDIECRPYPASLVLQDVLTLHGFQFRDAAVIVASPPCQAYSYRAMPWKQAKALPPPDNELFEACFRIQQEASESAGRYVPLVVENVRGAQKWVGRARWHFGSYYLWGDVPALMPITNQKRRSIQHFSDNWKVPGCGQVSRGEKLGISAVGFNVMAVRQMKENGIKGLLLGKNRLAQQQASALIAKIPFPLAQHIARVYKP